MPMYDFFCHHCGFQFEAIVLRQPDRAICPNCGRESVQKGLISLFNCTTVQLNKRLKMESEERMKKGQEMLKKESFRKNRMRIL